MTKPLQSLAYIYTHTQTSGTTGYFSCEPDPAPDLDTALELFAGRPMDSFLRQYILRRLLELDARELESLARRLCAGDDACAESAAPLLSLCLRLSAHGGVLRAFLPRLEELSATEAETVAAPVRHSAYAMAHADWDAIFEDNINNHKIPDKAALERMVPPCSLEELEAEHARLEAARGTLAALHAGLAAGQSDAPPPQAPEKLETQDPPPAEVYAAALEALEKAGLLEGREMRHEASLSPIALLRQWSVRMENSLPSVPHSLRGTATAYGRGLSLAAARAACVMEIVERASAYASFAPGGGHGQGKVAASAANLDLRRASHAELEKDGLCALAPGEFDRRPASRESLEKTRFYWLQGESATGRNMLVPAQAVFLFCNLGEPDLAELPGSTGLGAGMSMARARLAALVEVLEREAHASTPFLPRACFQIRSRDARIEGLLEDYRARGIIIQFQDISPEWGLPVYRCFVTARAGGVTQATGAGLSGPLALLSALTETPWPYVWARPAPYGQASGPGLPNLPWRWLEDLPDFSLPSSAASLELLENTLARLGREPLYVDISRRDLGLPVCRAFLPAGSPHGRGGFSGPGLSLLARALLQGMPVLAKH